MPVLPIAERKRGPLSSLWMPAAARYSSIGFKLVMRGHLVPFAAFFVQAHPPALASGVPHSGSNGVSQVMV